MKKVVLSVHQLVDFLFRSGDIDNRVFNKETMAEGSKLHKEFQAINELNVKSEVPVTCELKIRQNDVFINGFIDGVSYNEDGIPTILEVKTTIENLVKFNEENNEWHLNQAVCYAYMYLKEHKLDKCIIKLVYFKQKQSLRTQKPLIISSEFSFNELEKLIYSFLDEYFDFFEKIECLKNERNESSGNIRFPFPEYRKGQDEFISICENTIQNSGTCVVEAPTGVGKTISALFPAVKSFNSLNTRQIFYLTAKTSGKNVVYDSCKVLNSSGFKGSYIVITAKDKICLNTKRMCNPSACPFTKGYYTKLKMILNEVVFNERDFSLKRILELALKYNVCPFELELDIARYCDIIIWDYNYLFSPFKYMGDFFEQPNNILLVDEAHNLIDRVRDNYSTEVSEKMFLDLKANFEQEIKWLAENVKVKSVKKTIQTFEKFNLMIEDFLIIFKHIEPNFNILSKDYMDAFNEKVIDFLNVVKNYSLNHSKYFSNYSLDIITQLDYFTKIYNLSPNFKYECYSTNLKNGSSIKLLCLDIASLMKDSFLVNRTNILFSATLKPMDYFLKSIGLSETTKNISLPSPFDRNKFKILIAKNISTYYANRNQTINKVLSFIKSFISSKVGNYLIFVPSFEYLNMLKTKIEDEENHFKFIFQENNMTIEKKEEFLNSFQINPSFTTVGVAVTGGSFAEGIDLTKDRLIGTVVIGVGMPSVGFENDLIKKYYDENEENGFKYAYENPGINKIQQCVGRVIRSEEDKGCSMLIDLRYGRSPYKELFKEYWGNFDIVEEEKDIENSLKTFWKTQEA